MVVASDPTDEKKENPWLRLHHPGIDVYVSVYYAWRAHQHKRYPI